MNKSRWTAALTALAFVSLILAGCAPSTPEVRVETQVVVQTAAPVIQTQVVEVQVDGRARRRGRAVYHLVPV